MKENRNKQSVLKGDKEDRNLEPESPASWKVKDLLKGTKCTQTGTGNTPSQIWNKFNERYRVVITQNSEKPVCG